MGEGKGGRALIKVGIDVIGSSGRYFVGVDMRR